MTQRVMLAAGAAAALVCGAAHAQDGGETSAGTEIATDGAERPRSPQATLNFGGLFGGDADFDDAEGDMSVSRIGGTFSADLPVGEASTFTVGFGTLFSFYEFGDGTPFVTGDDDDDMDARQFGARLQFSSRINDNWSWFVGGAVESAAESGADFSESIYGGGYGGLTYAASKDLVIGGGVRVSTQLDDDVLVLPVLVLNWRFAPKWVLSSRNMLDAFGAGLTYEATDSIDLTLDAGYGSLQYRLDDEGFAPEGVFRDTFVPVALGVRWKMTEQVALHLRGGATFFRNIEIDDADENEVFDEDADASFFGGLTLELTF